MMKTITIASFLFSGISFFAQAQSEGNNQPEKITLPSTVNTQYLEARPLISGDGTTLFFNRRYAPGNIDGVRDFQDIYITRYDSTTGNWAEAENIGKVLNDKRRNAVASVNDDGTSGIFFNTYKDAKKAPLARSHKTEKGWSSPTPITIKNYVNLNEYADYHLAEDQNVLFLAIEGDVTQGQQDLYVSFPDGFGNWKEPINLGTVINSRESDFAPFLGSDGRSLFFSSYGHESMGGSDIFMSVRLDDTWLRWSTPINLGPGINTNQEESYFSITDDFKYMYYTSYTPRQTNRDILRVELPEDFTAINGPVLVKLDSAAIHGIMLSGNYTINQEGARKNFQGVSFEGWPAVDEVPASDQQPIAEGTTTAPADTTATTAPIANTETGAPATAVPAGESARYAGFVPASEASGLSPEAEEMKRYLQQKLPDLDLLIRQDGDTVKFKIVQNLEYDFNSVFVTPDYLPRLRTMGNILKEKDRLRIMLVGHTDEVGSEETNERVARQRVENLDYYFKRRGIEANRIQIVGVGNTEPLAANDSDANRLKNRRVEAIIQFIQ